MSIIKNIEVIYYNKKVKCTDKNNKYSNCQTLFSKCKKK